MKIHLYFLCYRFEALVASHLEPEAFGTYMAVGTQKNTRGNVLFFEIDATKLTSNYFNLDTLESRVTLHEDGSPKRSKYIKVYRVLEHIDIEALGKLYLTTADGRTLAIDAKEYNAENEDQGINLYDELCPVSPMVASVLAPSKFSSFMTDEANPIFVPKIFFADLSVDRDASGRLAGYLPYSNSVHIHDCIKELEKGAEKSTKTISRTRTFHGFYRSIRRGFFLGGDGKVLFYPFPDRKELEVEHSKWWRSATESLN